MKNKLTYYLFNWITVLSVGILGFILQIFDNPITFWISLSCIGYVAIVIIVMCFYAWIINPIKNEH